MDMREYILSVIGAAALAFFTNLAADKASRGYIKTVTGILVVCAIAAPAIKLMHGDILSGFDIGAASVDDLQDDADKYMSGLVLEELEKRVSEDAAGRLKDEFGISAEVKAEINADSDGRIESVKRLIISGDAPENAAAIRARFNEVYGLTAEEVVFNGKRRLY